MRITSILLLIITATILGCTSARPVAAADAKPNIIFFLSELRLSLCASLSSLYTLIYYITLG